MKKLLVIMLIAVLPLTANAKSKTKKYPIIEKDALIGAEIKENKRLLNSLVGAVKKAGYRCDSISAAEPFKMTFGYTLICNKHKYEYNLRGQGENFLVSVN